MTSFHDNRAGNIGTDSSNESLWKWIKMVFKWRQNTHEKVQLVWVENSKLFQKRDTSNFTEYEFNKIQEISKSYKNQNQVNIFKKISIKVTLK